MPLVIFVPPTLTVNTLSSLTKDDEGVILYVGAGVVLVSLIVTELLVASTVPLMLPERIEAVNVSLPSVVLSAVGVTENDPEFDVIVNDPELVPKSPELVTVQ